MKLYYGLGIRKHMIKTNIQQIQKNAKFNLEENSENFIVTPRNSTMKKKGTDYCCCGSCIV